MYIIFDYFSENNGGFISNCQSLNQSNIILMVLCSYFDLNQSINIKLLIKYLYVSKKF